MMKVLKRDEILKADDTAFETVNVPEWGGAVRVRTLSGVQRAELLGLSADNKDGWVEALVAFAACDDTGQALFTKEDIPALRKKSWKALQRVFIAAGALNGLTEAGAAQAKKK